MRVQALPKPTYDSDFTVVVDRTRLPELYEAAEADGFPVPDQYRGGWVDTVADMPLVTFRLSLEGLGIDVDIFRAESDYQHELLRRRLQHTVTGTTAWTCRPPASDAARCTARGPDSYPTSAANRRR